MNMTNCPNCGAPIIFGMVKCPYCETPYETPGGSESRELNRDIESREKLEKVIESQWDFDDDFEERATRYSRGERLKPKWEIENFDSDFNGVKELRAAKRSR